MKSTDEETVSILTAAGGKELPGDTNEMKTFDIVCTIMKIILTVSIVCGNGMAICSIAIFRTLRTHNGTMLLVLSIADLAVGLLACPLYSVVDLNRGGLLCNETANLIWLGVLILARAVSIHCILRFTLHYLVDVTFPFRQNCWKNTLIINVLRVMLWAYSITLATLPLTGSNNLLDEKKCAIKNTLTQMHDPLVSFVKVTTLVSFCGYICFLALSLVFRRGNMVSSTMLSKRIVEWKWRLVSDKLVILILMFRILLWLPYILMTLLINEYLSWNTAEMVAFAGSLLNPIMYAIASSDFRLAFKTLLATSISNWPRLTEHPLVSGNEVVQMEKDQTVLEKRYLKRFTEREIKLTTFNPLLHNDYQTTLSQVFESIVKKMKETEYSALFQQPVGQQGDGNNLTVIKKPMDLTSLLKNVRRSKYRSGQQFLEDVELIYTNSIEHYGKDNVFTHYASELLSFCRQTLINNGDLISLLETRIKEENNGTTMSAHSGIVMNDDVKDNQTSTSQPHRRIKSPSSTQSPKN